MATPILSADELKKLVDGSEAEEKWLDDFREKLNHFLNNNAVAIVKGKIVRFPLPNLRDGGRAAHYWQKYRLQIAQEIETAGYSLTGDDTALQISLPTSEAKG